MGMEDFPQIALEEMEVDLTPLEIDLVGFPEIDLTPMEVDLTPFDIDLTPPLEETRLTPRKERREL